MRCYECSNPIFGTTVNPHDHTRTPGGSSGGDGALIGAGGAILGMGSDIGGSLRIPAHFNGCSSLKPTVGRIRFVSVEWLILSPSFWGDICFRPVRPSQKFVHAAPSIYRDYLYIGISWKLSMFVYYHMENWLCCYSIFVWIIINEFLHFLTQNISSQLGLMWRQLLLGFFP